MKEALAYRPAKAASLIGVGYRHFYNLMRDGKILTVKVGGLRLVPRQALEDFIAREVAEEQQKRGA